MPYGNVSEGKTDHLKHWKMALINCRSLPKHAIEIRLQIEEEELEVIFLTETWLRESSIPEIIDAIPQGFEIYHQDRVGTIGGGIAIYVQNIPSLYHHPS